MFSFIPSIHFNIHFYKKMFRLRHDFNAELYPMTHTFLDADQWKRAVHYVRLINIGKKRSTNVHCGFTTWSVKIYGLDEYFDSEPKQVHRFKIVRSYYSSDHIPDNIYINCDQFKKEKIFPLEHMKEQIPIL